MCCKREQGKQARQSDLLLPRIPALRTEGVGFQQDTSLSFLIHRALILVTIVFSKRCMTFFVVGTFLCVNYKPDISWIAFLSRKKKFLLLYFTNHFSFFASLSILIVVFVFSYFGVSSVL